MPYWEEPKHNEPDEIDGPEDVRLPSTMHHMQVKAELDLLVQADVITDDEAMEVMQEWRARQELEDDRKLRKAVDMLEERNLLDEDQADAVREDMAS